MEYDTLYIISALLSDTHPLREESSVSNSALGGILAPDIQTQPAPEITPALKLDGISPLVPTHLDKKAPQKASPAPVASITSEAFR